MTQITDANFSAIARKDFSGLDAFIVLIGKIRSRLGFSVSDVQKAFELYRPVTVAILARTLAGSDLPWAFERINVCLAYTTNRFSDYFQALSEQQIREYAQTLEKKVEIMTRELAESEAKYRMLVEEIHDGYFVNQQGNIVFANMAFCDMHGYTPEELIGKYYTDLVAPESLDDVRKIYEKRVSDGGSKEQYLFFRLHKDGRALPTENRVTVTFYQGQVAGIGICRDITERVEIERRIRAAESLAHIGELTTSLAHEIRNPLSAAKMSIQMLLKSPAREEKDKRRLDILSKEISRLDRIVTEMLDFAKPMKLEFSRESLPELVDSCLEVVDARIREKGISVKTRFQKGLSRVFIDREKMEQAVINLLLNSMDAVSSKGEIAVRIRHARGDRSVQMEISDDGVGISAEDMPYVFDPFYSKKAKGTGLGLANVKKIIEAHGGSVGVLPRSPRGARFMASVPLRHEETRRREKENEVFLK